MKKLVIIVTFVLICMGLSATEYDWAWAKQVGGTSGESVRSIALDTAGNSYVCGYFWSTVAFGNTILTSSGYSDIFVAKMDPNGDCIWASKAGGASVDDGWSVAVDAAGNSYISGYFWGTSTFGTSTLNSYGSMDIFVAKLDANGNWLWAKQAGGTDNDASWAIAVDDAGNSYVCGEFLGTATFGTTILTTYGGSEIFVVKLDTNGNWLWVQQAVGTAQDCHYVNAITLDAAGNSYVCGSFGGSATFGTIYLPPSGGPDAFVAKLDSNGNWLWARQTEGNTGDYGAAIAVDTAGYSYISGFISGTTTIGTTNLTSNGTEDIFVAKLDPVGNWLWASKAGGTAFDRGTAIAVDNTGSSYLTGFFQDTAIFEDTTNLTSSGGYDIFVAKLDPNGDWLWAKQAGGPLGDISWAIAVDAASNCFFSGAFGDTATFGTTILTSSGGSDIFIAKLSPDGVFVSDELIAPAANVSHLGNAYPNPFWAGSSGTIKADVPDHETGVFTVYNLRGQVLQSHSLSAGAHEINVSATDLAPGVYFYRLKTPSLCEVKKLVVLK